MHLSLGFDKMHFEGMCMTKAVTSPVFHCDQRVFVEESCFIYLSSEHDCITMPFAVCH